MKKLALALGLVAAGAFADAALADTYVRGYTRKDGTYVAPHYRSDANGSRLDNWSTRGNVNPYTGQAGTRDPYANPYSNPYGRAPSRSSGLYETNEPE